MNDNNRGKGVTEKCIKNFDKLIEIIKNDEFPSNVILTIYTKGTLDVETIQYLTKKENIISYYQFFEDNYIDKVKKLKNPRIQMDPNLPNMAVPCPATVQDGKVFAQIAKLSREIEKENYTSHYFKYYTNITLFPTRQPCETCNSFKGNQSHCGSGKNMVGFLPDNLISVCHEGFAMLLDEYKKYAANRLEDDYTVNLSKFLKTQSQILTMTDSQYIDYEKKMSYINNNATTQHSIATTLIIALAMAGLVDS